MIIWLDLETTGLNPDTDSVLEVAVIVTEDNLTIRHEYEAVIQRTQAELDKMNEWCRSTHTASGLITDIFSEKSVPFETVSDTLLEIAQEYSPRSDRAVLAGSSIHFDKSFTRTNFYRFDQSLSYRLLDVSSFKEGLRRAKGITYSAPLGPKHRAMADIRGSMEEFKYYLTRVT